MRMKKAFSNVNVSAITVLFQGGPMRPVMWLVVLKVNSHFNHVKKFSAIFLTKTTQQPQMSDLNQILSLLKVDYTWCLQGAKFVIICRI